jgi:hypothetical protein
LPPAVGSSRDSPRATPSRNRFSVGKFIDAFLPITLLLHLPGDGYLSRFWAIARSMSIVFCGDQVLVLLVSNPAHGFRRSPFILRNCMIVMTMRQLLCGRDTAASHQKVPVPGTRVRGRAALRGAVQSHNNEWRWRFRLARDSVHRAATVSWRERWPPAARKLATGYAAANCCRANRRPRFPQSSSLPVPA